jgi:hypothetical protein
MGHIEANASNNYSVVACVFVTTVTYFPSRCLETVRGFLPSCCLAMIRGIYRHTHTDSNVISQAYSVFFQNKESRLKMQIDRSFPSSLPSSPSCTCWHRNPVL